MSPIEASPTLVTSKPEIITSCLKGRVDVNELNMERDKAAAAAVKFENQTSAPTSNEEAGANASAASAIEESIIEFEDSHHVLGITMEECDDENDVLQTKLKPQALFLDPFPTPTNSIGTNMSLASSRSYSPLRQRQSEDVFNPEFYNSPQRHLRMIDSSCSNGSFQTPIRGRTNSSSWNDPFPTPDVSVHSAQSVRRDRDPFPTPESHGNVRRADTLSSEFYSNYSLPCIEDVSPPDKQKRRQSLGEVVAFKSTPLLSTDDDPPSIRRISSESGLNFGRIPSVEDFIKTFAEVGPDGNDMILNCKNDKRSPFDGNKIKSRNCQLRNQSQQHLQTTPKTPISSPKPIHRKKSKDDLDLLTKPSNTNKAPTPQKTRLTPLLTPVRNLLAEQGRRASNVYKTNSQRIKRNLRERREKRRLRREARLKSPPRSWWIVIPADHPYKIIWDVLTMVWALLGAYRTHLRIRDRVFDQSPLIVLTEVWFTLDILLNFVTEHKTSKGQVIRDGKTVWARYLTTWFVIDLLSLIPWERIYVRPVVEQIKKRNFFQKTFFRSKAVVRVSRVLRGRHIKLMGRVSRHTGTPLRRFVGLLIKYVPKYLLFFRHMKGALFVRGLRFVHWLHNIYKTIWVRARNAGRNARQSIMNAGRNARRTIRLKRRRRHPSFVSDEQQEEDQHAEEDKENDEDSDSDGDDDDDDSEDDEEDYSHFDMSEVTSIDMSEGGEDLNRNYIRSRSDNLGLRRRTYSGM